MVKTWANRKYSCTRRQLQSLLGHLIYIHKCVKPSRFFVNRMLDLLRQTQLILQIIALCCRSRTYGPVVIFCVCKNTENISSQDPEMLFSSIQNICGFLCMYVCRMVASISESHPVFLGMPGRSKCLHTYVSKLCVSY